MRTAPGQSSLSSSRSTAAGFTDDATGGRTHERVPGAPWGRLVFLTAPHPRDVPVGTDPLGDTKAYPREGAEQRAASAAPPGTRAPCSFIFPLEAHPEPSGLRAPCQGGLRFVGSRNLCKLIPSFMWTAVRLPKRPRKKYLKKEKMLKKKKKARTFTHTRGHTSGQPYRFPRGPQPSGPPAARGRRPPRARRAPPCSDRTPGTGRACAAAALRLVPDAGSRRALNGGK